MRKEINGDALMRGRYRVRVLALGELLRGARERRGLTQEEVALIARVTTDTYRAIERAETRSGEEPNPSLSTLLRVTDALDIEFTVSETVSSARDEIV